MADKPPVKIPAKRGRKPGSKNAVKKVVSAPVLAKSPTKPVAPKPAAVVKPVVTAPAKITPAPIIAAPAKPIEAPAPITVAAAKPVEAPVPAPKIAVAPVAAAKPAEAPAPAPRPVEAPAVAAKPVEAPAPAPAKAPAVAAKTEATPKPTPIPVPAPASAAGPAFEGFIAMATTPNAKIAAEKVQALFGDFNERAKTAFEKSAKIGEDLTELTKGNVEAIVASARVAAKGAEALTQEAADYSKKSFETATGALKSFAAVKSPTELFQLQSDYAKSSFDNAVAEASKLSEAWVKLAGEVFQPLSSRYAVAAEKLKASAAL